MQLVTIVNRSSKPLKGVWDGRHYTIEPGKHEFPEIQARKFKEQNPVMGSEDPFTLEKQYLIAIVNDKDDDSPMEQSTAAERWDRKRMHNGANTEVVRGNGLYSPRTDGSKPLSDNSTFVEPSK